MSLGWLGVTALSLDLALGVMILCNLVEQAPILVMQSLLCPRLAVGRLVGTQRRKEGAERPPST